MDSPPESEFTQAEVYAPMEALVAESVAALPDFPGFEQRSWAELPCSHNGQDDPDYTNIEIRYTFSLEDSGSELVRVQYTDQLREYWTSQGLEIETDSVDEKADRTDRNLVAQREDGISIWYSVWGGVGVRVNSGCVPVSDLSDFEYVPPAGGIEPGSEGDLVVSEYFPDGIPTDEAEADAIAPFGADQVAPVAFDSPRTYEDQL